MATHLERVERMIKAGHVLVFFDDINSAFIQDIEEVMEMKTRLQKELQDKMNNRARQLHEEQRLAQLGKSQ